MWHDALAVKIPDAQRAFSYKKIVVALSERISNQMEHKINHILHYPLHIETRSLLKGTNLANTEPIKLLTHPGVLVLKYDTLGAKLIKCSAKQVGRNLLKWGSSPARLLSWHFLAAEQNC